MLIFLDIDGVMVPAKGWRNPEFLDDGFPAFSIAATNTLQRLITDDVTIILTTSHEAKFSIDEWALIFKNRGINIIKMKFLPENSNNLRRKDEIVNWFIANKVEEEFVIIDDDNSLNELPEILKAHLVQTSSYIGLTEEHVEMVEAKRGK